MITGTKTPASGALESGSGVRMWVLIAGGLMALGWLLAAISIVEGAYGGFAAALFMIMIPVNIFWRFKQRGEWKRADPEGYAAAKKARRRAGRRRQLAILGWGARGMAAQAKHTMKADSTVEVRDRLGQKAYTSYDQVVEKPRMGMAPGLGESFAESGRWWRSFLRAFFTPMRAAVAEWRSRP